MSRSGRGNPDHVLPAGAIGPLLADLVCQDVNVHVRSVSEDLRTEVDVQERDEGALQAAHVGVPSEWPCPDCSGVLWQVDDEPVFCFSCRVGHAWTAESLLEQQGDEVDTALWMALRNLEDRASLSQMLADRAAAGGRRSSAARFRVGLDEMNRSIEVLRRLLTLGGGGTGDMG